jgi:hypothetical protein
VPPHSLLHCFSIVTVSLVIIASPLTPFQYLRRISFSGARASRQYGSLLTNCVIHISRRHHE